MRMLSGLFVPAVFYIGLVAGGVLPFLAENELHLLVRVLFAVSLVIVLARNRLTLKQIKVVSAYVAVTALTLTPLLFFTTNQFYAAQKIESVVLGTAVCYMLLVAGINRYGWDGFRHRAIVFALLVLGMTVLYKLKFGFWDRETRFFLNGPIVFGWLMGLHAMFALMLWSEGRKTIYLLYFLAFLLAVIWTQSKGPLLALFVCVAFMLVILARRNWLVFRNFFIFLTVVLVVAFVQRDIILESLEGSRLQSIAALFTGETQESDQGSIGTRGDMLQESMGYIMAKAPFGIGVGEWPNVSRSGVDYPHNEHLEILVEMGVPWFVMHVIFVFYTYLRGGNELRIVMLFFLIASSFSGDVSYLRYVFPFALLSFSFYGLSIFRTTSRRVHEVRRARS